MIKPHLYLDTCIILDGILGRRQASIQLLEQAKSEVENGNWECSTSRWTIIELLDNLQEERYVENLRIEGYLFSAIRRVLGNRRQKEAGLQLPDLDDIWIKVREYLTGDYSFIATKHPTNVDFWDKAEDFCASTNIGSTDSIHLTSAILMGCNILVTTDGDFIAIANRYLSAVHPSDIDLAIRRLNRY
jgi:predicted nucleic acid-binding protein